MESLGRHLSVSAVRRGVRVWSGVRRPAVGKTGDGVRRRRLSRDGTPGCSSDLRDRVARFQEPLRSAAAAKRVFRRASSGQWPAGEPSRPLASPEGIRRGWGGHRRWHNRHRSRHRRRAHPMRWVPFPGGPVVSLHPSRARATGRTGGNAFVRRAPEAPQRRHDRQKRQSQIPHSDAFSLG